MIISEEIINQILEESQKIEISFDEKNYNLEKIIIEIKEITKDFNINEINKKITENFIEIEEETEEENSIEKQINSNILNFITFKEIESYENSLKINLSLINKEKKLDLLNINEEKELTNKIFLKNPENQITCMGINFDYFFYGDIFGNVNIFSISGKKFLRTLEHPKKKKTEVTCFDFNETEKFLIVGYKNGEISLFDITNKKAKICFECKNNNNKNYFELNSILDIKFFNNEKKIHDFFYCNKNGCLFKAKIKDIILKWNLIENKFIEINNNTPIFLIKIIKFSEENKNKFSFLKNIKQKILILGTINKLFLYKIKTNEIELLFTFESPIFFNENSIPDINFGIGKLPIKNFNIYQSNFDENNSNQIESQCIITVCWSNVIFIYLLPILNKKFSEPILIGNYINDEIILKIGFITNSFIYLYDKNKYLKIITSQKINIGNVQINNFNKIIVPNKNDENLIEKYLISNEIKEQMNLETFDNHIKKTYLYSIIETNEKLCLFSKEYFFFVDLNDFEEFFNSLDNKKDYLNAIKICIEIFQGKNFALKNMNFKNEEKKRIFKEKFNYFIIKYINDEINNNLLIEKLIENSIYFCIEIENIEILLFEIFEIFNKNNEKNKEIFLNIFYDFIINDKIKNFILDEKIILKFFDLYSNEKLEIILIHIFIENIDKEKIKNKIIEKKLINPLLFLFNFGLNENLFEPILIIFNNYLTNEKLILNENFFNDSNNFEFLYKEKEKYLNYFYLFKILWYIDWLLKGKKFPNKNDIQKNIFEILIPKIFLFLISKKILKKFVFFNSKIYFEILTKFFFIDDLNELFFNEEIEKFLKFLKNEYEFDYNFSTIGMHKILCEYFYYIFNNDEEIKKNNFILLNFYIFMCKASKFNELTIEIRIESFIFIYFNFLKYKNFFNENEFEEIINYLKINLGQENSSIFTKEDYNNIFNKINLNNNNNENFILFNQIFYFIYSKNEEYEKCFKLLINKEIKNKNQSKKIFSWLNNTLMLIKQKNKNFSFNKNNNNNKFDELKKIIFNNLILLAEFSINDLYHLIKNFFDYELLNVIEKLKTNEFLLKNFLEIIINNQIENFIQTNEEIEIEGFDNLNNKNEKEILNKFLIEHLNLLCKFKEFNKINYYLKKTYFFYLDLKIPFEICKKFNLIESLEFLYKIRGEENEILNMYKNLLEKNTNEIINILFENEEFNFDLFEKKYNEHKINLEKCIKINKESEINDEKMWFNLLYFLYNFNEKFKEKKNKNEENEKKKDSIQKFENYFENSINKYLEQMFNFVSIKNISTFILNKFQNAKFFEFKNTILEMIKSYNIQKNILFEVKNFVSDFYKKKEKKLLKNVIKAKEIFITKCEKCKNEFNLNENVILFNCKHFYHKNCCMIKNKKNEKFYVCSICENNQLGEKIIKEIQIPEKYYENEENEDEIIFYDLVKKTQILNEIDDNNNNNNQNKNSDLKYNKLIFRNLKLFENKYYSKKFNFIENSIKISNYQSIITPEKWIENLKNNQKLNN